MTQDETIEMARQAGFEDFDKWSEHYPQETKRWCERMEAFAKLVEERTAAKEREACAKLCEDSWMAFSRTPNRRLDITPFPELEYVAKVIRSRGEA